MKVTLIVPDVQIPYHIPVVLKKIIKVAEDIQPDVILQGGDLIDLPMVSRWTKGTAGEYAETLQSHITQTKDEFFSPLRAAAPKAAFRWLAGNHDDRLHDFVKQYAYPLRSLDALSMESLFELDKFGVTYERGPIRVATNTVAIHGHEPGGYSASPQAWDLKFLKRYGNKSVVFFHTHQPYLVTSAHGYDGNVKPRFVMNAGSIMNPEHATYVKDGSVAWVPSFALLRDDGKRVWPELVTMTDRLFYVSGKRY